MKFQSFLNFPKKIQEIIKMFLHCWFFTCCPHPFSFRASFFIKRPYMFHNIHTFIMFKHVEFGKHTWIHTYVKNLKKTYLKFLPGMKCSHVFFFIFSSRDEISSLSLIPGWNFILAKTWKQRHFTINRDDFIRGRVLSLDEISRVNTL